MKKLQNKINYEFNNINLLETALTHKSYANENNIDSDVTVIKTKFKSGDEEGTIAIIGPKRMEYDRVVGLLEYMKENIER